ncbi:hypothetical protein D2E25_0159 [Bifidobacterium goeldii]|uniref:Glycine transporter domain-containing protein n=1 Tax=Bifidobacterium goeldii TaxID=2306975 RepID=A0A430FLR6_9BIFI|nr:TRIC cation channel family protein [Bifidobacterium goeldii]RSX53853.1 hypothetical protein D2E25_0159 [Bifidobacterium goeldii]
MEVALESNAFFMGIEYLAIFCSGLMGGLCAVKKNYDLFAMMITAWLTALGGGIIRDVMLGSLPPVGIADKGFVITALVSGLVVAVIHPEVDNLKWSMLSIDALSVGLFAVNGTAKAMIMGTSGMTAVFMGMFTALGGGLVRDMLLNDVPMIIRDKHWYAIPSAVGCVLTVLVMKGVQAGVMSFSVEVGLDCAIVVIVVVLRLLSVKFNITLPGAMERHEVFLPSQTRYLQRPVIHPNVHDHPQDDDSE